MPGAPKVPFANATNLVMEVRDITLDNMMVELTKATKSVKEHWSTFNYAKVCFIQRTRLLTDPPNSIRIGILFQNRELNYSKPGEAVGQGQVDMSQSVYRYQWLRVLDPRLADLITVELCHVLALTACNATPLRWNAIDLGLGLYVVAPSKAIETFVKRGQNGTN